MFLLYAILSYFLWAYIHEYAHLLTAKKLVGVKSYTMRIYPHTHPRLGLVFASVSYEFEKTMTKAEKTKISFAPRIPDAIALFLFPFTYNLDLFWIILVGGGLVDTIRGSFIFSPTSDIKRYCDGWGLHYPYIRTVQLSLVGLSLSLFILLRGLQS
jgi:hypothetical protein